MLKNSACRGTYRSAVPVQQRFVQGRNGEGNNMQQTPRATRWVVPGSTMLIPVKIAPPPSVIGS